MSAAATLSRVAFTTDRSLEFLSESELTTQIGYGRALWPLVLVKELIDNALDGCERAGQTAIEIGATLEADFFTVSDNGPGLASEIIERALDYTVRVSDKKYYVAPTRGQLGNALKCVFAAPFVVDGDRGVVEIEARGLRHQIKISLDRIAQKPKINHGIFETRSVKKGTSVKVHWNGVASSPCGGDLDFYQSENLTDALRALIADYGAFNPHASFTFNGVRHAASQPDWRKWRTDQQTSVHWYRPEDLRGLIAAYIREDDLPVRDFLRGFAGLSGTQIRKTVLIEAAIAGSHLSDLVAGDDVDMPSVDRLLAAMRKHSKPIQPKRLGVIGKDHLERFFAAEGAEGFRYSQAAIVDDAGLPIVLETGFGIRSPKRANDEDEAQDLDENMDRRLIFGLNWSPVFKLPSGAIGDAMSNAMLLPSDAAMLLVHAARPRFAFSDHGKGALAE